MSPKKKVKKTVSTVKRVWMVDIPENVVPGGYIELSEINLWIKLSPVEEIMEVKMDMKALDKALNSIELNRYSDSGLDFWSHRLGDDGEALVVIEPSDEVEVFFSFEVSLKELKEALYYFVG